MRLAYQPVRVETWRLVGRLNWLLGRPKKAFGWWKKAIAEAERLEATGELARTFAEMALRARPRHTADVDVSAHLDRARRLFVDASLAWDLAQLDTALRADGDPAAAARF